MKRSITLLILLVGGLLPLRALHPERNYAQKPNDLGLAFKELDIATPDGATLRAWHIPAGGTQLAVICHDGEGNMGYLLETARDFHKVGYGVLMFDYRGFGGSSDFTIDTAHFFYGIFQTDLRAVLDYAKENFAQNNLLLYGKGVGAGLALGMGYGFESVKAIVADCPFLTAKQGALKSGKSFDPTGYVGLHDPLNALQTSPRSSLKKIIVVARKNRPWLDVSATGMIKKLQPHLIETLELPEEQRIPGDLAF